ncbi:hypothetical protein U1Q18_022767 [Sarracenia purpurea var. burkii]
MQLIQTKEKKYPFMYALDVLEQHIPLPFSAHGSAIYVAYIEGAPLKGTPPWTYTGLWPLNCSYDTNEVAHGCGNTCLSFNIATSLTPSSEHPRRAEIGLAVRQSPTTSAVACQA